VLRAFAGDDASELMRAAAPGIAARVLLDALSIHVAVEGIAWRALDALYFVSRATSGGPAEEGIPPRTALVRGDGVARVLAAIAAHASSEDVAWRCAGVVVAFTAAPDVHRSDVLLGGGLIALVKIVRNHFPSVLAQEHALKSLGHLVGELLLLLQQHTV
jgi:hypothetical protein